MASYRVGDYEAALTTLEDAARTYEQDEAGVPARRVESHCRSMAFVVMALARLGRMDEAREEIIWLVEMVKADQAMNPDLAVIIDEAQESIDSM